MGAKLAAMVGLGARALKVTARVPALGRADVRAPYDPRDGREPGRSCLGHSFYVRLEKEAGAEPKHPTARVSRLKMAYR